MVISLHVLDGKEPVFKKQKLKVFLVFAKRIELHNQEDSNDYECMEECLCRTYPCHQQKSVDPCASIACRVFRFKYSRAFPYLMTLSVTSKWIQYLFPNNWKVNFYR